MGYTVYKEVDVEVYVELDDFKTSDLIKELKSRGYDVRDHSLLTSLEKLYSTYLTCSRELFEKELKKYFRDNLHTSL